MMLVNWLGRIIDQSLMASVCVKGGRRVRQYMRREQTAYKGDRHYIRGVGDRQNIIRGVTYYICVFPPPSLSIIRFCSTIFLNDICKVHNSVHASDEDG